MKVGINFNCRQLHEFIERPGQVFFDESVNFKFPGGQVHPGRAVRIQDRPFFGARLSPGNAIVSSSVGADDDFRIIDLLRWARLGGLVFRVVE